MEPIDKTNIVVVGGTGINDKIPYLRSKFKKLKLKYSKQSEPKRGHTIKCPSCMNTEFYQQVEECGRCLGCGVLRWEHLNTAWGKHKQYVAHCYDTEDAEYALQSNLALYFGCGMMGGWFND